MGQGSTAYSLTGGNGGVVLSTGDSIASATGDTVTGKPYCWIKILSDCTFSDLDSNLVNESDIEGVSISAPQDLVGHFGNVTLTTGSCIVYKR